MEILQSKVEIFTGISKVFISYLKAPYNNEEKTLFQGYSKASVFITALIIAFFLNFCFTIVFSIIETMGLVDFEDHASTKLFEDYPPYVIVLLGVLAAPILEELIFRGPLTAFTGKKGFKYVFYFFALAFGLVHITNFEITRNVLILAPILVAPQIIIGLFLGIIRLQYGLIYSILFHAIYNGIIIIPAVLLMTE
ncbi:CAAX amino terminal protease family [Formosa agariphila KMM 3901]|uniref:CAAX amino terminal protease family n=1 Tax=Formosa agariphila (strain DSM 15362 / KCTC 12365 / LMG 23005 / KMM 3901 / M-2Alg 35-1) TaxID=1347342 RepID=T2KM67_FORAG|nr:CPBP family intramembrane glutamic endopeptidase [Formosa agariphila]CDF79099.1 CAAX amino terminal protease family [Formosa agariphila KMM 3901]